MKKHLYYVVEIELIEIDGMEETTGNKTIRVYEMIDNKPCEFTTVNCTNDDNSEEMIQGYLDDNGYGDDYFEFHSL